MHPAIGTVDKLVYTHTNCVTFCTFCCVIYIDFCKIMSIWRDYNHKWGIQSFPMPMVAISDTYTVVEFSHKREKRNGGTLPCGLHV